MIIVRGLFYNDNNAFYMIIIAINLLEITVRTYANSKGL